MAREKSFHQKVMEAGFGAHLERNGFERVSAVFYRRVHPLFELHVTLSHGYPKLNGPRAFIEQTGIFFPQLVPIHTAYTDVYPDHNDWELDMRNKTASAHAWWEAWDLRLEDCRRESVNEEYLRHYDRHFNYWFFKPKPSHYSLSSVHKDIGPDHKYLAWAIREDRSLEDFVEEFCGYWQQVFDAHAQGFTDMDALKQWVITKRIRGLCSFGPQSNAMLLALGETDFLNGYIDLLTRSLDQSKDRVVLDFQRFSKEWKTRSDSDLLQGDRFDNTTQFKEILPKARFLRDLMS